MIILRPHLLTIRNRFRFRRADRFGMKREVILVFILFVIMGCIYTGTHLLFAGLKDQPVFLSIVPKKILETGYFYFFILLVVSNTVAATGNIYTADNMNLLLAAPLTKLRLYAAKFVETFVETSFMFYVFTIPALLAFTVKLHLGASFFFTAILISIPFLLIPVGLGIALSTLAASIIAWLWRRGGMLAILLMGTLCWGVIQLSGEVSKVKQQKAGAQALINLVGIYQDRRTLYLPSTWASDIASSFLDGDVVNVGWKAVMLIAGALFTCSLGYLVFDLFMLRVRSNSGILRKGANEDEEQSGRAKSDVVRTILEKIYSVFPLDQQTRAIVLKDLSSLIRDKAQALQLVLYLGLLTLYTTVANFMSAAFDMAPIALQLWLATLSSMNILFAGFILITVMTRLVYPSVSLEGKAFWLLQVTPIDVEHLVRAKLLCWLPVSILMSSALLLSGALALTYDPRLLMFIAIVAVSLGIGFTGLAIGLGSVFASFDWESPNQIAVGLGTLTLLLATVILVLFLAVPSSVVTFFVFVPRLREIAGPWVSFLAMSASLFLIIFTNIAVAVTAVKKGAASLIRKRGELV